MGRRLGILAAALIVAFSMVALTSRHTSADVRDFTLYNNSDVVIVHVYVSPSTTDDWEEDVLGQDVLSPGDYVNIHFSRFDSAAGQCSYDIRVDGKNGERGYLYSVDLCSVDTVTFS